MKTIRFNALITLITFSIIFYGCQQGSEVSDTEESVVDIPVTSSSTEALSEFYKGLDLFDGGNGQNARTYFSKAIELDPDFASAYLYRSFTGGSAEEFSSYIENASSRMEGKSEGENLLMEINKTFLL